MNIAKQAFMTLALLGSCAFADIGIGYDHTLDSLQGVSIEYKNDGGWMIQGILNVESNSNTTVAALGLRFFYPLIEMSNFHTYAGLGLDYSTCNTGKAFTLVGCTKWKDIPNVSAPSNPLVVEIPVRVEYHILPILSIHTQAGLKIGMYSDGPTGSNIAGDKAIGFRGDLIGTAGFTVWLGAIPASVVKPKPKKKVKVVEEDEEDDAPVPAAPTPSTAKPVPAKMAPAASLTE